MRARSRSRKLSLRSAHRQHSGSALEPLRASGLASGPDCRSATLLPGVTGLDEKPWHDGERKRLLDLEDLVVSGEGDLLVGAVTQLERGQAGMVDVGDADPVRRDAERRVLPRRSP